MSENDAFNQDPLTGVRFALRKDLSFSTIDENNSEFLVIYDPVRSDHFRIGKQEAIFARLLDGNRTIADAIADAERITVESSLSQHDYLTLIRYLLASGLVTSNDVGYKSDALQQSKDSFDSRSAIQRLNLIFVRIPLFNPDRLLQAIIPYLRWCFTRFAVVTWLIICLLAIGMILSNSQKVAMSTAGVFSSRSWMLCSIAWIILKLVHEMAHGVALCHYGRSVREFGILFILFIPVGYTDASSAWQLPSKWQRIVVAAAGMYTELFLASIATLVWWLSKDETIVFVAFNIMITAGVSTIIFNMNPLMRFDGYYIISDLLGVPNLYTNGVRYVRYLGKRYLAGLRVSFSVVTIQNHAWFVKVYGICAFFWRTCVVSTLLLSASLIVPGVGPLIAAVAALVWFVPGLVRFLKSLQCMEQSQKIRFFIRFGLSAVIIILLLTHVAWPGVISSPGYVDFRNFQSVRPRVSGFVRQIHVEDGQYVRKGDTLVTLENRERVSALHKVKLDLAILTLRSRMYLYRGNVAATQIERQNAAALRQRKSDLEEDVKSLHVVATVDGKVAAPLVHSLMDRFVTPAHELFSIVDEDSKEILFSIAQDNVEVAREREGKIVHVEILGANPSRMQATLSRIDPEANQFIPHLAISSLGGGPIAVRTRNQVASRVGEVSGYEFIAPRFNGALTLDKEQASRLKVGQVCKVRIRSYDQTILARLSVLFNRWVRFHAERKR